MAENGPWLKNAPPGYDGRQGERFDDELKIAPILWTVVGLAVICLLGMLITWQINGAFLRGAEESAPPPSPIAGANDRRLPPEPRLQSHPEGELQELRREMAKRLSSYGWVDEASGTVHMPIDEAIDLLLTQGSAPGGEETSPLGPVDLEPSTSGEAHPE